MVLRRCLGRSRRWSDAAVRRPSDSETAQVAYCLLAWRKGREGVRIISITVLIVSQVRVFREGLARTLAQRPGIHGVHTAGDLPEALAQVAALCPEVVLLDLSLGFDCSLTGELHAVCAGTHVVVLGVEAKEDVILTCVENGASGYLSLDGSLDDLVTTIYHVVQDRLKCSPSISAALARRVATLANENGGRGRLRLTPRECQVLKLIRRGMSNREIAASLDICISTVKNHIHSILGKLHVTTRAQAAASRQ